MNPPSKIYKRILAFLLDRILFISFSHLIFKYIFNSNDKDLEFSMISLLFIFIFLPILIYAESSKYQAFFGKWLFKMKVVDLNMDRINLKKSFFRQFFRELYSLTFIVPIIVIIFGFFDKQKQLLHDKVVDTLVVDR